MATRDAANGEKPPWLLNYDDLDFVKVGARKDRRARLGKGAFGEVYAASLGAIKVAVKEFDFEFLKAPTHQQQFLREVRLLHGLEHAHVVRVLGACAEFDSDPETAAPPFIVFEFLPTTLSSMLFLASSDALDHSETVRVAMELAAALDYLHRQTPSIVHRDVKPEKVMLTATRQAKLIGFGFTSTVATMMSFRPGASQASDTHGLKGTLGYMPPEKALLM